MSEWRQGGRAGLLALGVALLLMLVPTGAALAFTDVGASTPYRAAIEDLASRGIIEGYKDGSFQPSGVVWRQHFAKMITLTLGLSVFEQNRSPFADVPADPNSLYPDDYIRVAAERGITRGYVDGTFGRADDITRAQVIAMVVRAVDSEFPERLRDVPSWYESTWGGFDPVYGPMAAQAEFNGLLSGLPLTSVDPWGSMPRGEVCQILDNLGRMESPGLGEAGLVTGVVDGDTVYVLVGGEDVCVRLIGIDTPEVGEPYSYEAKDALTDLVGSQVVRLETDVEERDQYGRMLAYVWVEDGQLWEMANERMLLCGLATLYTVPPNVRYTERLQNAQDLAEAHGSGMWGDAGTCPLEVVSINYDALGNDNDNLNDEYITFRTLVSGSLVGYAIEDATGHRYMFSDRVFPKGQVFRLRTGQGVDSQSDLYWGASGSAIWNNSGDIVKVIDPQGQILLAFSY